MPVEANEEATEKELLELKQSMPVAANVPPTSNEDSTSTWLLLQALAAKHA